MSLICELQFCSGSAWPVELVSRCGLFSGLIGNPACVASDVASVQRSLSLLCTLPGSQMLFSTNQPNIAVNSHGLAPSLPERRPCQACACASTCQQPNN